MQYQKKLFQFNGFILSTVFITSIILSSITYFVTFNAASTTHSALIFPQSLQYSKIIKSYLISSLDEFFCPTATVFCLEMK